MYFFRILTDMISDWPLGTLAGILLCAIVAFLLVVGCGALLFAADSWFRPREKSYGRIVNKTYTSPSTMLVPVGEVLIPMDDDGNWSVTIEVRGQQGRKSISRNSYDSLSIGQKVLAEVVYGRFSGNLYIKSFSWP